MRGFEDRRCPDRCCPGRNKLLEVDPCEGPRPLLRNTAQGRGGFLQFLAVGPGRPTLVRWPPARCRAGSGLGRLRPPSCSSRAAMSSSWLISFTEADRPFAVEGVHRPAPRVASPAGVATQKPRESASYHNGSQPKGSLDQLAALGNVCRCSSTSGLRPTSTAAARKASLEAAKSLFRNCSHRPPGWPRSGGQPRRPPQLSQKSRPNGDTSTSHGSAPRCRHVQAGRS